MDHEAATPEYSRIAPDSERSSWAKKYGAKFRLQWIRDFPEGIIPPQRVRIYRRNDHYLAMWWDPAAKKNLSDRIDGDLVTAIARARQIEEKLDCFRSSGLGVRRLNPEELVERFLADLSRRADAELVDPATVLRYRAALGHFLAYCAESDVAKAFPHVAGINREFQLGFSAFLADRRVARNGRANATARPMQGQGFIRDTVRAMLEWAADPDRGNLLPAGFRNPFLRRGESRSILRGDPLGDPDITLPMALDLMNACDGFQLLLFAPMLLFGLRAAEPCFLMHEYFDGDWLKVPNNLDINYKTKGRRDKRFPLIDSLRPLWEALHRQGQTGLLYIRRGVSEGREKAPLQGCSLQELVREYRDRCAAMNAIGAARRRKVRDHVLRDAGGMRYDDVENEFATLARRLGWPAKATLKDLRHLFATTMGNSAMPEGYRRYLMGQAPGKAVITVYTHLNQLREHFARAVETEWSGLVATINTRLVVVRECPVGAA